MKIIKLPAILPGDLDLEKINQQLRDRTVQLDWSAVVSASNDQMAILLAGLDLSDDADVLGDSTLSEAIANKVVQVLQDQPEAKKPQALEPVGSQVTPAVWQREDHPHPLAPSPIEGEGGQEQESSLTSEPSPASNLAPLLPAWEKGLGNEVLDALFSSLGVIPIHSASVVETFWFFSVCSTSQR